MDGLWRQLLSKADEVLVVSVDVRELNINQQQNLQIYIGIALFIT